MAPATQNKVIVVLAAGRGTRMADPKPKVLIEMAGETLLERHRRAFTARGFSRQVWVLGYEAARVENALRETLGPFEVVLNTDYEQTASGFSLLLGLEKAGGPACFMDADLLYDLCLFEDLDMSRTAILYSSRDRLDDEMMKVYADGSRLVALKKDGDPGAECKGESVGMGYLDAEDAGRTIGIMRGMVSAGSQDFEWEDAVAILAGQTTVCVSPTGYEWIEMDFPADVEAGRALAARLPRKEARVNADQE